MVKYQSQLTFDSILPTKIKGDFRLCIVLNTIGIFNEKTIDKARKVCYNE